MKTRNDWSDGIWTTVLGAAIGLAMGLALVAVSLPAHPAEPSSCYTLKQAKASVDKAAEEKIIRLHRFIMLTPEQAAFYLADMNEIRAAMELPPWQGDQVLVVEIYVSYEEPPVYRVGIFYKGCLLQDAVLQFPAHAWKKYGWGMGSDGL